MPPKAETQKSDLELMREQLDALRGELTTVKGHLNEANTAKVQAELATMTEGERRLLAEETAADNAIASAENEATALEGQLASLWSEGKFPEAASLQRKIASAETVIHNEKQRKEYLSYQREQLKGQRTEHAAKPVPQEQTQQLDPAIQRWIDAHPRFNSDDEYTAAAKSGHYEAVRQKVPVGSAKYFEIVELHTGDREPEADPYSQGNNGGFGSNQQDQGDMYSVQRPQQRAAGPGALAAAPSRGAPGGFRPGRPPDLSPEEREVADGIMGHIADPGERYQRYHAAKMSRQNRGATH